MEIICSWKKAWSLNWTNLNSLYPRNTLCHVWLKLAQRFWRRFSKFCYYLPIEKGQGPSFDRKLIPLTQGYSVPSLVEIGPVDVEKKSIMFFHFITSISLWQRAWPFIWTNLNHLYLRMLYVKYGGTWLGDSEEFNMLTDMDGHLDRETNRW